MEPESPITARPNPPRRSWFAVWRWRPWVRWTTISVLVVLGPMIYFFSHAPVLLLVWMNGLGDSSLYDAVNAFYYPLHVVYTNSDWFNNLQIHNQNFWLDRLDPDHLERD